MQFGFGGDDFNLPHRYVRRCVAYTGTHDNDTICGWFKQASASERRKCLEYLDCAPRDVAMKMIRALMMSVAETTIFPTQDLLGLGNEARMNVPGTIVNNWSWRVRSGALNSELAKRLRKIAK